MWPPALSELKTDLDTSAAGDDTRDDVALQVVLDAAVEFVQRVRPSFNYDADPLSELPDPPADLRLGTLRLASRWHTRRRSPDALVAMAELGAARVPSFDPDIERLLGIGRYRGPVFA
ncbi:MAG TPA: hypothetical protein VGD67_13765 [Pseudonocardiaceae bacterium]